VFAGDQPYRNGHSVGAEGPIARMTDVEDGTVADIAAVQRIAARDQSAVRELYERHGRPAFAIAYRLLGDRETSEECVQDAFVRVWENASRYDAQRSRPSTWLYTIVRNLAIDAARRRSRRPVVAPSVEGIEREEPPDLVARADDAVRIADAMAGLPAEQFAVIKLAHFDELSQSEIATKLRLPLGTVKSRTRLGLDRLRAELELINIEAR
jgi:RNA polymerase sigma-70 factor, ECF subfamily